MIETNPTTSQSIPFNVSLIIPALNEAEMLIRLLDSIEKLEQTSDYCIYEVIVVDAASSDCTADLARSRNCIVINTKPGHVATSRNLGAAKALGNILAFIDADCELPSNWLTNIINEFQQENIIAVGSRMAENQLNTTWVEKAWYELAHRQYTQEKTSDVEWLATFNIAVEKRAFDSIGGFDESLTTCEDVEFGYRLSSLGTLRRLNSCGVIHNGESKTIKEFYRREAWRARGALGILANHWNNPRELISFLLPITITGGLLISAALIITCMTLLYLESSNIELIAGIALAIGPMPVLLLTLRRQVKWSLFIPCGLLMCIYFYARCIGTLRPFPRVERTDS